MPKKKMVQSVFTDELLEIRAKATDLNAPIKDLIKATRRLEKTMKKERDRDEKIISRYYSKNFHLKFGELECGSLGDALDALDNSFANGLGDSLGVIKDEIDFVLRKVNEILSLLPEDADRAEAAIAALKNSELVLRGKIAKGSK